MNKTPAVRLLAAGALLLMASTVGAQTIVGSKHDLSAGSGGSVEGSGEDKICKFCHAPHGSPRRYLLWNRSSTEQNPGWAGAQTTLAGTSLPNSINLASKICLDCHDNSIAIGLVFNPGGRRPGPDIIGGLGETLANYRTDAVIVVAENGRMGGNHPVSIQWQHQDVGFAQCSGCHWSMPLPFYGAEGNKQLECGTCHEPHNKFGASYPMMLRKSMNQSELCFFCHDK